MGFLAPWFLAGAAAVALPLYLHLLRRRHANPRPFSSLMFFERNAPSSIRQRRLRYYALLSLRVALLLLLALAFADPFIMRPASKSSGNKLVLLVIDNSFSMRAGSRMADARRDALSVLAGLRGATLAEIMTLGSQIHVLTRPTKDRAALRAAIDSVAPGDSRGSFADLAHTLRSMTESIHTPIEVHLFSDMQKSEMPASFTEMALPANVSLVPHAVVRNAQPNWAVESVDAPGQVWGLKKTPVRAVIAGYHTPPASRTASLIVNGKITATRQVKLPADGRAAAVFPSLDVPYGLSRCEVKIDSADSLPADDVALFGVKRADPKRVLLIHEPGDSRSPLYFGAALESAAESAFRLESVTANRLASINPSSYAFVVISDVFSLPASFEEKLLDYVHRGGGVLVTAGTSAARGSRIPVFGASVLEGHDYTRDGAHFLTVGAADKSYPSIGTAEGWSGVKFFFVVRVNDAHSQVAARLADDTPLLLEKRLGAGRVLLFASGFDNLTNDFPLHPAFVPFVDQTAFYLSGIDRVGGAGVVDSWLDLKNMKQTRTGVQVIGPDGRPALPLREASAQAFRFARAGFYEFHLADGQSDLVGVNPDRRESDLGIMPADILSLWSGRRTGRERVAGGQPAQSTSRPYDLWWYIMLLVLAMALAESILGSRYLRKLRENP